MEKTQSVPYQSSKTERESDHQIILARSRFDLMAHILTFAKKECRQTEIMHKCNLSYRQIKVYLSYLADKRMLAMRTTKQGANNIKLFRTTRKGKTFLKAYQALINSLKQS